MHVQRSGRARRSEHEWQQILARHAKSGLSDAAFCRREKLSKNTFAKWKKALGGSFRSAAPAPAFIELAAPPPSSASDRTFDVRRGVLEIELPGGVVVRWRS